MTRAVWLLEFKRTLLKRHKKNAVLHYGSCRMQHFRSLGTHYGLKSRSVCLFDFVRVYINGLAIYGTFLVLDYSKHFTTL